MLIDYMTAVLNNEIAVDEIDNYIEAWHNGDDERSLQDSLGMTDEEMHLFITTEDGSLDEIIKNRKG